MPSLIKRMLRQKAVYWSPGIADEHGQPRYDAPQEIKCRWVDVNELFLDMQGAQQVSNSKVYVGMELELGGFLLLGEMDSVMDIDNPTGNLDSEGNPRAYIIRKRGLTPNLKATEFLRTVWL